MIFQTSKYVLKRVLRDFISIGILFVTPLALITILGLIADGSMDELLGIPMTDSVALSIILAFQLFSGFYTLELIQQDLLKARKWRLMSLPVSLNRYMYSIILVTTTYGGLQSFMISHYTRIVYGVNWGSQLRLLLGIMIISFMIQTLYLNIALFLKDIKTMERTATGIGLLSLLLGGVWFQLPDNSVLNFLGTYGNPYSLAQNILLDGMKAQVTFEGLVSMGICVLLGGGLVLASEIKGRKLFR